MHNVYHKSAEKSVSLEKKRKYQYYYHTTSTTMVPYLQRELAPSPPKTTRKSKKKMGFDSRGALLFNNSIWWIQFHSVVLYYFFNVAIKMYVYVLLSLVGCKYISTIFYITFICCLKWFVLFFFYSYIPISTY